MANPVAFFWSAGSGYKREKGGKGVGIGGTEQVAKDQSDAVFMGLSSRHIFMTLNSTYLAVPSLSIETPSVCLSVCLRYSMIVGVCVSDTVQWVKVLAAKPADGSLIPRIYMMDEPGSCPLPSTLTLFRHKCVQV